MLQTTLCYLEQDGKYLMLHRVKKKNDVNHDKWIGVGGKFEAKEAPEECLLREVREETGLTLLRYRYRGLLSFLYNDKEPEYIFTYTADRFCGRLSECDEGTLEWVAKEDIGTLSLWEGDRLMFRLLAAERAEPFSLKLCYTDDMLTDWAELSGAYEDILSGLVENRGKLASVCGKQQEKAAIWEEKTAGTQGADFRNQTRRLPDQKAGKRP